MTHCFYKGLPIDADPILVAAAERAELVFIGCGVPVARRVGAIASFTTTTDHGLAEFHTIRRWADDPKTDGVGQDWRLIDTCRTTPFEDGEDSFAIGLPPEDLKTLRAGGHNLEGFDIYIETTLKDRDGNPFWANAVEPPRFHELRPTRDYIDAWKPRSAEDIARFEKVMAEHEAWLSWN